MATRDYSSEQEQRVAKLLGGKKVANSGATAFKKGDVVVDDILIECKTKIENSANFTIKKEWIEKIKEEAFSMNITASVLAISFGDGKDYFVINSNLMKLLVEYLKEG